jgi:2-dehydro-3-deoxygluconokinase
MYMGFKFGVIGPLNIDLIIRGSAPSDINELRKWADLSDVFCLTAGAAGYFSQNLKKLGNDVHLVSCLGDDPFGAMILSSLKKVGINTDYISIEEGKKGAIGIFILLFGDNKRPLTYRLPTHHGWPPKLDNNQTDYLLNVDLLHSAGYLHFSNLWNEGFLNLFKAAKEKGVKTSMDPQFPVTQLDPPWIKVLKPLIPFVDILMVDENEAMNLTNNKSIEAAANSLYEEGFEIIAVKMGEKGVLVKDKTQTTEIPAITPREFVDSIGAGDSFDAGFLQGLMEGKSLEESAKIGVFSASKSIEGVGGSLSFPTRGEIEIK